MPRQDAEGGMVKQKAEDLEVGIGTRRRRIGRDYAAAKDVEVGRIKEGRTAYDSRRTAKERGGFAGCISQNIAFCPVYFLRLSMRPIVLNNREAGPLCNPTFLSFYKGSCCTYLRSSSTVSGAK